MATRQLVSRHCERCFAMELRARLPSAPPPHRRAPQASLPPLPPYPSAAHTDADAGWDFRGGAGRRKARGGRRGEEIPKLLALQPDKAQRQLGRQNWGWLSSEGLAGSEKEAAVQAWTKVISHGTGRSWGFLLSARATEIGIRGAETKMRQSRNKRPKLPCIVAVFTFLV